MSLASIVNEIFPNISKQKSANNFLSIAARDMKIPSFDASRHDESNELCLVLLRSLGAEILRFNSPELDLPGYFCHVGVYAKT